MYTICEMTYNETDIACDFLIQQRFQSIEASSRLLDIGNIKWSSSMKERERPLCPKSIRGAALSGEETKCFQRERVIQDRRVLMSPPLLSLLLLLTLTYSFASSLRPVAVSRPRICHLSPKSCQEQKSERGAEDGIWDARTYRGTVDER